MKTESKNVNQSGMMQKIVVSLLRQAGLTEEPSIGNADHGPCNPLECPRLLRLTHAIIETIGVLEQSKGAFKSKTLGDLRIKLQRIVNDAAVGELGKVIHCHSSYCSE